MQKRKYTLSLLFAATGKELLYQGLSRYNSKIIDSLEITTSHIRISFDRMAKANPEDFIYSEISPVRYQLYRAACFYLTVTGILPKVKSITLREKGNAWKLDKTLLTQNWENCHVDVTLPKETAAQCFQEENRIHYTMMTYFLKAQLDPFPHDAFRAAWSGLNAFYNTLSESQRESDKLAALRKLIRNKKLDNAEKYAKELPEDFWRHIQWHNYVQWRSLDEVKDEVVKSNQYRDKIIFQKLSGYICNAYQKDNPDEAVQIRDYTDNRMKKKVVDPNERIRFLVTEYCYMLRNRSFHADKPYPIFGMKAAEGTTTESILTTMILLTIRDLAF